jgi:ferric-dicitrate binding protein FerR (iron transport regulator)
MPDHNISGDLPDSTLLRHLEGNSTQAEQQEIEQWIAANIKNKEHMDALKRAWEQSTAPPGYKEPDVNEAWARFVNQRANGAAAQPPETTVIKLSYRPYWRAAAGILLVLGTAFAGYLWWQQDEAASMMMADASRGILTVTLPDQSTVVLNQGSLLHYPKAFGSGARQVRLEGEGYFSVTPDKRHPFELSAGGTEVRVLGTAFNVATKEAGTEVIVSHGLVAVSQQGETIKLGKGEGAIAPKGGPPVAYQAPDDLYQYYIKKEFVCRATPLSRLAVVLSEAYHVHITIANNKVAETPITTTLAMTSLDDILKVIQETLNVDITKHGDSVLIK